MLTITIFLFQNVALRFLANCIGSPSAPALAGYLSTSSHNTTLIGLEAKPAALLLPTSDICPPLKTLCVVVLFASLALGSLTLPLSTGVSRSIGASLSLLNACAISKVGCTKSMGQASCAI